MSWWKKCKERFASFLTAKRKEEKGKKGRKSDKRPRTGQVLEKSGRLLFLLFLLVQIWPCVNAAAEGLQKGTEMTERKQNQEVRVKESRWVEEISLRWKQPKGKDRTEMSKEAKLLRCTYAKWISVEHGEEVHERVQRNMRLLLRNRAQIEDGGNRGAAQRRGQGRLEVCSGCSETCR